MYNTVRKLAAAGMCGLLLLAGCGGEVKFEPTESSLYLRGDGSLKGAEITAFDNTTFGEERYSEEELKVFVEDAVKNYNSEAGSLSMAYSSELEDKNQILPVSIESLTVEENVAELIIDYASCDDYLKFNAADDTITYLSVTSAPVAVAGGVSLDGYVNAKGEPVDTAKARESEKYRLASVNGTTTVVVNGSIVGVLGAEILDGHTARTTGGTPAYILFK